MNPYEKSISDSINSIANKEVFFSTTEIMSLSEEIASEVVGELLVWACNPTNDAPIMIARKCLKQFPVEWVSSKIKQTVLRFVDIADDWDYRRLLELCELISLDLLKWAIGLNEKSTNPDIIEAIDDFNEILKERLETDSSL